MLAFPEDHAAALDAHYGRICSELIGLVRSAHIDLEESIKRRETSWDYASEFFAAREQFEALVEDYEAYYAQAVLRAEPTRCASHMVCRLTAEGILPLRVSERVTTLTGYASDGVQADLWSIVHPDHREESRQAFEALAAAMLDGQVDHTAFMLKLRHRAGCTIWSRVSATYLQNVEAHPHVVVLTFKNDSEKQWVTVFLEMLGKAREQLNRSCTARGLLREIDRYLRRFEADETERAGFRKSIPGFLAQASTLLANHVANQFFPRFRR
ncbi:MAG: PAS domain-containing protein [Rhodothermales bacterium]